MAAEIARAASTPSGSAAGGAAAKDAQKPVGPGTVLVVPKKKQSSPPLRTPKKLAAVVAVGSESLSSKYILWHVARAKSCRAPHFHTNHALPHGHNS